MADEQNFLIALSPAQRWKLLALAHPDGKKIPDGQEGRKYRRFCKAFGLKRLADILRHQSGEVPAAPASDEQTRYLHAVTIENVEYGIKVLNEPKSALDEDLLGDVFDLLENLKAAGEYTPPEGLERFDVEKDAVRWTIPQTDDDRNKADIKAALRLCSRVADRAAVELPEVFEMLRAAAQPKEEPAPAT